MCPEFGKKSSSEYVYGRGFTSGHPIESMFAAVRLRHRSTKGNGSSKATLTMVFKLCKEAEKNWRRLKEFEKLRLVQQDVIFVDGLLAA